MAAGIRVNIDTGEKETFEYEPEARLSSLGEYQTAIQSLIDETARSKDFHDGVTVASYVPSTVDAWAAQARAFVAWRDGVWQYAYAELAKVEGGVRTQPTVEQILGELPKIVWP